MDYASELGKRTHALEVVAATLGGIVGKVSKIDRDSKRAERTDLDDVWATLYAIKAEAREALQVIRQGGPKPQLYSYSVTVDYRTKGGRCSTWCGHVYAANIEDATRYARERIERRKSTLKIDGGTACPMGRAPC